jgi:hypothetical protein
VLANVDREASSSEERRRLRLAALVHDAFKFRAAEASAPVASEQHHGAYAARFLACFVDDEELVNVVRWHDEAFAAYQTLARRGDRRRAQERAAALVERLGPALALYLRFFRADNATAGKSAKALVWFDRIASRS